MPARTRMTPENIAASLPSLAGWSVVDGKLHREFKFADFIAAWGFMSRVALIAQSLDHHPDWSNVYNTVRIDLDTHDAGGITEKDFELARRIDALLPSG